VRSQPRFVLVLIALALPAAGLAAGSSGSAPASRSEVDIERTIKKAVRAAVVDRNYRRACRFGTERGRRRLLRGYNSSNGPDYPNCAAVIRHEVEEPGHRAWIARLRDGVVVDVLWVRGDRARTRVADGPAIYPGQGFVRLLRVDGRWRLHNSTLIPYGD
jgi:hypothetical protein